MHIGPRATFHGPMMFPYILKFSAVFISFLQRISQYDQIGLSHSDLYLVVLLAKKTLRDRGTISEKNRWALFLIRFMLCIVHYENIFV